MRLANGTGTVYKDKSRPLRKPYKAVVTTGWKIKDGKAIPVRKCLGYFASQQDGLQALLDYKNHGLPEVITFGQATDKWFVENEAQWSENTIKQYKTLIKGKLPALKDRNIADLRVADLERILDVAPSSALTPLKAIMHGAYDWAMRHDYIDKDYSRLIRSYSLAESPRSRVPFSTEEILTLWKDGSQIANSVLVAIYSGWRWNELMTMEIDMEQMIMTGGSKTEAGKGRVVPIHHAIKDLLGNMFVTPSYSRFRAVFMDLMKKHGMNHTFHETRHTTATLLYGQDEHLVKLILGHAEMDITKRVYTHNTIEQLRAVIESIDVGSDVGSSVGN